MGTADSTYQLTLVDLASGFPINYHMLFKSRVSRAVHCVRQIVYRNMAATDIGEYQKSKISNSLGN